jgi:sugar O-acyltransferase (sialic acid O-acetyltransferase NeuD family)
MPTPILVPLVNPNEPDAFLAELKVQVGARVEVGDLLAVFETTKSAAELLAETDGYVLRLEAAQGATLRAGAVLLYLGAAPDEPLPPAAPSTPSGAPTPDAELRITQPALALAQAEGLDLARLPRGPLVTEHQVRALLTPATSPAAFDPSAIVIYGGGGHAKALIDLVRTLGSYRLVGVIDDDPAARDGTVLGVPILGGASELAALAAAGVRQAVNAVGGIGDVGVRVRVFQRLAEAGFVCPTVIHPRAVVEASASLAAGAQVFPLAYIGSAAEVGFGAIVNTGAIVSHDCRLGAYTNLSPGAILAGEVRLGERVLVGMGATINLRVQVGAGARIGNGATVKSDLPAGAIVKAGGVWPPSV